MSQDEMIAVYGTVTAVYGKFYQVKLDSGALVQAHKSGKLIARKQNRIFIRICIGDRVQMQLSPYDLTKGIIVYRGGEPCPPRR